MSVITLNVDEAKRTLSASDTNAFVINDKNVDVVRFALLTGFADIALDEHSALRVMYQRPGETQVRAQTLTYYDTDGIRNYYDWELLAADLAKSGTLTVALCILRTDSEVEEWHTTPYQIRVLGSIHTDDSDEADETITPTVAQRVAVLESMIQRVASGAPVVVSSASEMTDTEQIYVLTTDGYWYYHNGSAWVAGGTYGAVATDTTLTQSGVPADAKAVGDAINAAFKFNGALPDNNAMSAGSALRLGSYTARKTADSIGLPDDMVSNHYCAVVYFLAIGNNPENRTFLVIDSTTGEIWLHAGISGYKKVASRTDIEDINSQISNLSNQVNGVFQYRGTLSGDPTTADVKTGTYTSQKTSNSTGYPEDMANHYCVIQYLFVGASRYFTITDTTTGEMWFWRASAYTRYALASAVDALRYKWSGKKWAAMGDSLTAVNTRATKRYHDYISGDTGITVVNLGVSGTGYKKPYNSGLPFWQRIDTIPSDSDVITIFGSGNDLSQTLGSVTDTGTETICGCINTTIDSIRSTYIGANLGVITPTPWIQYPTTDVGNKMDLYADALVQICRLKSVPCLDLYHCSNMLPWEQAFREAYYTRDDGNGVHPDENGHKFFAPKIRAFLETLL